MDHSDEKTADFERRTSRRMSRQVSIHTSTDLNDVANNDAYLAAMGISISDGFRPSDNVAATPADTANAANADQQHRISISTQKTPEAIRRPSSSADSHDAHLSPTTGFSQETSSISTDFSSSYNSSEPSPSAPSPSSYSQSPLQLSSVPVSVPETEDQEEPSTSTSSSSPSPSPTQPPPTSQPAVAARGRPSSIAKPPLGSLSLGGAAAYNAGASGSRGISGGSSERAANVRESTASSVAPTPQQDEPYEGPSGPSFPYGMYPQNVGDTRTVGGVAGTPSATPSESTYTGPRGPAFPYGMYPQGTMTGMAGMPAAAAGPSTVPASAIPVGFPGMSDNYQRRIGPDGEDMADLIGPDGHTEQLPPYTRYPDEAYSRKIAAANETQRPDPLTSGSMHAPSSVPVAGMFPNTVPIAVESMSAVPSASTPETAPVPASASSSVHSAEPAVPAPALITSAAAIAPAAASIPGAGGIGLAPRNPEFDGTEEAGSPRSRYSLRSFNSDGTGPEINTAARGMSEKRKPPNFIQRYGGRRILGIIPYWAICLVLTAVLIMCIILGAVVGTFVARHKRAQSHHDSNAQSITVTVDATPIPTPSNLALLPTGTFSLPLQKDEGPGACFNDTTQAQAWSCNIPFQYSMSMTISSLSPTPGGPMYNLSIDCNMSATVSNDVYFYGEQAPVISTPMPMQLVNDTLDPNRGPAWFKMMPYNKTVVVHETYLSAPAATATGSSNKKRNKDNVAPASIVWGEGGNPFHRKGVVPAQAGDKPWVCTWPDTILEVFIYPNQNTSMYKVSLSSTFTPSFTTTSSSTAETGGISGATATSTTGLTTSGTTSTGNSGPTQFPNMPPGPPPFPRVVKVEERRMAKSPQATCVQYLLKNEGYGLKGEPLLDVNGNIVEITIAEVESGPSLFSRSERDIFGRDVYESDGEVFDKRDSTGLSKCGCLWMVI